MTSDTQKIFQQALALHQNGQFSTARDLYRVVLGRNSRHFDSLHLLGLTFIQEGFLEQGAESILQALAVRSDFPEAYYNLGNAQLSMQRAGEAIASFDKAIRLNPRDPQYHFERGNALKDLKRPAEALEAYEAAAQIFPGYAEAYNNAGIVLKEAERFEDALSRYDTAIRLKPDYAEAHGNRGNVLRELHRLDEALASYDTAIRLKRDYAEAHSSRGNVLRDLKHLDEALASQDRAIRLKPDYAEAHVNRGNVLKDLNRLEEALASYDKAIHLNPGYAEAYSSRGNALMDLERPDEALASHDKAISLKPDSAEAYTSRGSALKDLNRLDAAMQDYDRAICLNPSCVPARYNKSLLALERGSFREGFELYLTRWAIDKLGTAPQTVIPAWDGAPSSGDVLLWAEQGIGDEVFFASMLSLLDQQATRTALSADKRLHPIFERSFPGIRLVDAALTRTSITGDFAAQAPIGDLGHIMRLDAQKISQRRYPYLVASPERKEQLKSAHPFPIGNLVCGLSWRSGNKTVGADRSIGLPDLGPLLTIPGVSFVSLQYGDVAADIGAARERLGVDVTVLDGLDVFGDIDGLLALIDLCDVVVTIDNLTAHLAGAIAKDTAVLVPTGGGRHWYWGGENQSLWYPSLRLMYQGAVGDWASPIADASRWVARYAAGRST